MAVIIQGGNSGASQDVESDRRAARVVIAPRGNAFSFAGQSGTIAAALGANSALFAMRLDPSTQVRAFIERLRLDFTTIVAFTTPVTAGRRLSLFRGSGGAASGGTAFTTVAKKHSASADSEFESAQGGDVRIATTGGLTVTGITFEANEFATLPLTHVGNAGNFIERTFEFSSTESAPIILEPGQILAIRNPAAMDAAGTFQVSVRVDWHEAPLWS